MSQNDDTATGAPVEEATVKGGVRMNCVAPECNAAMHCMGTFTVSRMEQSNAPFTLGEPVFMEKRIYLMQCPACKTVHLVEGDA